MKVIAIAVLLLAATPAAAQHTLENSNTLQDRITAKYDATHGRDNQHDDKRSYDERFPGATPGKKLDCSVSHDDATNVNTIGGCRYVPR